MADTAQSYSPAHSISDGDEMALAEQLLPSHRTSTNARAAPSPRWAEPCSAATGAGGWRKWHLRQRLWSRSHAWFIALTTLAAVVLCGGAASTRPHVRDYVKERMEHYAGHGEPVPKRG